MVGDAEVGPAIAVNGLDVATNNGDIFLDGQTITGQVHIEFRPDGTTDFSTTGAITNAAFNNVATGFAPHLPRLLSFQEARPEKGKS